MFADVEVIRSWIIRSGLPMLVWQALDDGQSYVRATALTTLGGLRSSTVLWQNFTTTISEVRFSNHCFFFNAARLYRFRICLTIGQYVVDDHCDVKC